MIDSYSLIRAVIACTVKEIRTAMRFRGSYISAPHVLLNLLNEFKKRKKCEVMRAFYPFFFNILNKFNNTDLQK